MTGLAPQIERLLAFSVEQYRELQQHAEKLVTMLNACEYAGVHEHAARLQELQAAASQHDAQLLPLLKLDLPAWEGHPLWMKRLDFIGKIVALNELLMPKIRSMKAVFAAELDQLKGGRVAMHGYQSTTRQSSGMARGTC